MMDFFETALSGPRLPATVLLGSVCVYWFFMVLGAVDIEMFDFDFDIDGSADGSLFDWGVVGLRFFNLGDVPVMLWMTAFSGSLWALTLAIDGDVAGREWYHNLGILVRNGAIALVITKVITHPLRGLLSHTEPTAASELIGEICTIQAEATETAGQAEYKTDASPLYLNVRTMGETLTKGTIAVIIDYDPESHVYFVKSHEQHEVSA